MPTGTAATSRALLGDLPDDKNLLEEPPDHAIGTSCRGLTTQIHSLVDGKQRPLVMMLGPGQAGDSPMPENLMDAPKVKNPATGTPQRRPARAMADNAYSSKGNRKYLRERGIQCVTPEKDHQKSNRKREDSAGGMPVTEDKEAHRGRNVVERRFNALKQ